MRYLLPTLLLSQLASTVCAFPGLTERAACTPTPTPGALNVTNATLYYETVSCGQGPLVLFISGANGDAFIWESMASYLAQNYTVALYDRRGFSRSNITGTQDYVHRLATDADDAAALIKHLAKGGPAYALGTSSGAAVALELLLRHSDVLTGLVSHEVPALRILPDAANLTVGQLDIYNTYVKYGTYDALLEFAVFYAAGASTSKVLGGLGSQTAYSKGNVNYWFDREVVPYPLHNWSIPAIGLYKDKLLLANGNASNAAGMEVRSNKVIGQALGLPVNLLPGDHVGYTEYPAAFASALSALLQTKS